MKGNIIFCFFITQFLQAQDLNKLSLFDCIKLARESHPYFQDKQRIIDNSELKIKNTNIQWLPQLNANAQATYQSDVTQLPEALVGKLTQGTPINPASFRTSRDQYKATIDVNQMLYDGGSVAAQKKITNSTLESDMFQNESELHKITEQVNQVYFGLLVLRVNIKLLESVKNTLLERQKSIEAAVHDGILQESDLDYIKIEILKSQQQIDELFISYKSGIIELSELTNKNLNDSLVIEIPTLEIADTGTFQRAELKGLDAQKTSLDFSDKLYKSQRLPHIYAFSEGGYGRPGLNMLKNDFELFYIIGLSLKWPIWDWNQTSNNRQSLLIQKDMFNSRKLALEKNLRISILNSQARISQLEKSLITDSTILELRINITIHSSLKLDQGVIAVPDYINDLDAETQSRIQLQSHKIQLVQEKANYLTIKGTL